MHGEKQRHIGLSLISVLVGAWLIVPTLIVIPISFADKRSFAFPPSGWSLRFYRELFTSDTWISAIVHSFTVALSATVIATILGTLAAIAIVKMRIKWLAGGTHMLLLAPLVFPIIVVAIALYIAYLQLGLNGTFTGFLLADTMLALPLPVITITAGLRALDVRLAQAAQSLGATPWTSFFSITVPLIMPSIAAGAIYAFMIAFDEVVIGLFIQTSNFRTLPVQMYISATAETDPIIASAATILVVLSLFTLVCLQLARNLRQKRKTRHV